MRDRANNHKPSLPMSELLAWVGGLAALAALIFQVIRLAAREPNAFLLGGVVILYVVYVAFSVPVFWNLPRVVVPVSLIIGGTLWALTLHQIERTDLVRLLITSIFIPLATFHAVRLISPNPTEEVGRGHARQTLVPGLLSKGIRLGNRSHVWIDQGDEEIRWIEPGAEILEVS